MRQRAGGFYGLVKQKKIKVVLIIGHKDIVIDSNASTFGDEEIEISESRIFNVPDYVLARGLPLFPSKYEFVDGKIVYHSVAPPRDSIKLKEPISFLEERAKIVKARLDIDLLKQYDRTRKLRPRRPSQQQVMGESAREHIDKLIRKGLLSPDYNEKIAWHWCHLVAFSMLPNERAQRKGNLVCGTSAFNGQMLNIELAVKNFIYETKAKVSLEVTATYVYNTHLALRMRYQIYEKKSGMLYREYFDALTGAFSEAGDFQSIYEKMIFLYRQAKGSK